MTSATNAVLRGGASAPDAVAAADAIRGKIALNVVLYSLATVAFIVWGDPPAVIIRSPIRRCVSSRQ